MHKAWYSIEKVPYCFSGSSIKLQAHMGWQIGELTPTWVRLLGRSQLSNPSDLPCWYRKFWYIWKMSSAKCRLFGLGLSIWLVDMIWGRCEYYAFCCCVFKLVVLYVKRRFVLYCSRARMRLCSPFRNYSVDVPECVGMKTFRKTHETHSFSMPFRQMVSFVWKAIFIKGAS